MHVLDCLIGVGGSVGALGWRRFRVGTRVGVREVGRTAEEGRGTFEVRGVGRDTQLFE